MKKKLPLKSKAVCPACGKSSLTRKISTYPVKLFDGRQVNVGRVALDDCDQCHHLIPTKAGSAKVTRCLTTMSMLFFHK